MSVHSELLRPSWLVTSGVLYALHVMIVRAKS